MSRDPGQGNASGLQVEKKQDVVGDEAAPGQDFYGKEIRAGKNCHMRTDEILPSCVLAAFRRRGDALPLENVSDGLIEM